LKQQLSTPRIGGWKDALGLPEEEVGRARGFDGIFVAEDDVRKGAYVGPEKNVREIVIWEPNQAKSATHNVGTFDPENPDVTRNPGRRRSRRRSSRRK
jgi:hypothetical protein